MEFAHIDARTGWASSFWLTACEVYPVCPVAAVVHKDPRELDHDGYRRLEAAGCKFYTINWKRGMPISDWASDDLPMLSGEVSGKEAVLTFMSCTKSCLIVIPMLKHIFKGDPYVQKIEQLRILPRPRLVLFSPGFDETPHSHDTILITTYSGNRFILDISNQQFGIKEHLFNYDDYIQHYTFQEVPPVTLDIEQTLKDMAREADRNDHSYDCIYMKQLATVVLSCCEMKWQNGQFSWSVIDSLPAGERRKMFDELASTFRDVLMTALEMRQCQADSARTRDNFFPRVQINEVFTALQALIS